MFSRVPENVRYGVDHYRWKDDQLSTITQELYEQYKTEGIIVPYTAEDYKREQRARFLAEATPEERIAGFTLEQRLIGLKPEERLAGLKAEERLIGLEPEKFFTSLPPEVQQELIEVMGESIRTDSR
ncbi:MAG: hypothetical protein MI867_08455 [Pseudomonadales bacterium]|nr:hypothetical protein [Pseudomonadales bacterium]